MSSTRRSKVIAKGNILKKTPKTPKESASRKLKVLVTPLEHTPFRNMYFSLIKSRGLQSAPNSLNALNLNQSIVPTNPVATITIVDIDEIKKRPIELLSNKRKIAKIKPVLQNDPVNATPIKGPVDDVATKYDKSFFLSYVSIKTINFEEFIKLGPITYKINAITTTPAETPSKSKRRVSFATPNINHITQKENHSTPHIPQVPKRKLSNPQKENIGQAVSKQTKLIRRENIPIVTKSANQIVTENLPAISKITKNKIYPTSSKIHHLVLDDYTNNTFVDPYEPLHQKAFSFEAIAYKISNTRYGIKLPSRQWCCSLWQHIVSNKKSNGKPITKYNIRGTQKTQTLYYEENIIGKRVCSFAEITKMKSFNFRRYQLGYENGTVIMEPDRCVTVYRNGDYDIRVQGKILNLIAAPIKVRSIKDIAILLDIIDSVKLIDICSE